MLPVGHTPMGLEKESYLSSQHTLVRRKPQLLNSVTLFINNFSLIFITVDFVVLVSTTNENTFNCVKKRVL